MKIRKLLLAAVVFVGVLFSACSSCEQLARRCPPVEYVRDSIHVTDTLWFETIVTDTPMTVKLPTEYIYLVRPHNDTVKGETAFTRGMAWCDGESLNLELINKDSAEVLVQRIKTLERQLSYWKKISEHRIVHTEYRTRGIVRFLAWTGGIVLILLFFVIAFHIMKRFIKP